MLQKIGIIAIGDELVTGRIINTTSSFAAQRLFENGYQIHTITTIGDQPELIGKTIKETLAVTDAVIITGGLGSTDDDITNEATARALNLPIERQEEIEEAIGFPGRMAALPAGAKPLLPKSKIAGYQLEYKGKQLFFLPGVPDQMRSLFMEKVLPALCRRKDQSVMQRVFRIFNLPEMEVNRRIATLNFPDEVQVGYYPVLAEVHLSLTVRSKEQEKTERLFTAATQEIEARLAGHIYSYNEETMEMVVGKMLASRQLTLATAESCTGGLIGKIFTDIPGSSSYFLGGVISYANSIKSDLLGVEEEKLATIGAVSGEVAEQMARGIRRQSDSDLGLGVTGIAGPAGGSPAKPVGTVYIALAAEDGCQVQHFTFHGNRQRIRLLSAYMGINMVRQYLLQTNGKAAMP